MSTFIKSSKTQKDLVLQKLVDAANILSSTYGVTLNLDIKEFCSLDHQVKNLGTVLCEISKEEDLDILIFLDRDFFSASLDSHHYSVLFEEVSHFYALASGHILKKNLSQIELEAQSELDRLLCTLTLESSLLQSVSQELREKLFYKPYEQDLRRETSRNLAKAFVRTLSSSHPQNWTNKDFKKISSFFYADFSQKCSLARYY